MDKEKYIENAATLAVLLEAGLDMMRENIRRKHVGASQHEIETILAAWLRREDDPVPGDTSGVVRFRQHSL